MCFQVILAYESIVLCMCSGKYIDIYFIMKITFVYLTSSPLSNHEFETTFLVYVASLLNPWSVSAERNIGF